ncbi:hypothetical protein [Maridesulfovibrio ferrireducens]|uniref:hypothetical protein n=1 Tax=Maridesulfovibrio ferrireducens TaxID=246191 RepID=UPI001A28CF58|nr:hypothetical protein [Maridesulfovibrio ferrireducens]MBI9110257.1 hypothetical protein [Maridesulfovibrio ferrireducens]
MSGLSLATLKNGAAIEMVDYMLMQVADNVLDPNTEATAQRKIIIEISFKPDKEREIGKIILKPSCKLAPQAPVECNASFGTDEDGCATMSEFGNVDPNRALLPGVNVDNKSAAAGDAKEDEERDNVTPLKRAAGGNK